METPARRDEPVPVGQLTFLGEATIESGLLFEKTPVGGLSAIAYDAGRNLFYALADDPSYFSPARLYGLTIDLEDGRLDEDDVSVASVVSLTDENGEPFGQYAIDGEGLALTASGGFFLSSEGNIERGLPPLLLEISRTGATVRSLPLPERYLPDQRGTRGVRHNLAFEALSLSPDGRWLFAGIENALLQDGSEATLDDSSPARILRYDALSGEAVAEYLYWVEPVPQPPAKEDGFHVNGLVELLALDEMNLLALERAFAVGTGNTIRIYHLSLSGADDILGQGLGERAESIAPVHKTLLLDLAELGIRLDNLEGLTFGPDLDGDLKTLLLVADNNFSLRQRSQLLAFSWRSQPVTIPEIQGAGHRSPLEGSWLWGLEGIVTAVDTDPQSAGFWLQSREPDGRFETSEAILVTPVTPVGVEPGDQVVVSGRVTEPSRPGSLSVTRLERATVRVLSTEQELPPPVTLDGNMPAQIDDDQLSHFDVEDDAIDLLESLEGMRVTVPASVVVGPRSRFGDFVVAVDSVLGSAPRTFRGGLLLAEEDTWVPRIQIDPRLLEPGGEVHDLRVGTRLQGRSTGVLDYSYGAFELVATDSLPPIEAVPYRDEATRLRSDSKHLTVATFNVENLDALDSQEKFEAVARTIVRDLGSPDLVALQEIQDDNGTIDDGVVSATRTLARLVEAIVAAEGPRYRFAQIDPVNNADGGQPGANIRVGFLASERVRLLEREPGDPATSTRVTTFDDGSFGLSHSPGRVGAEHPAFAADEALGYEPTRKPLALEVEFAGEHLFLINAHLRSKGGDDRLFGSEQPPQRHTERQRSEQASVIRQFVEEILLKDPEAAIVVLGDLNEHEFRPPIQLLTEGSLTNLVDRIAPAERYTHNFRGTSAVLDHILVSPSLAVKGAAEIDIVHVNADRPARGRSSDHDPLVVRLAVGGR